MGKKHKVWKEAAYRYLKTCENGMAKATDLPLVVKSKKGRRWRNPPHSRGITWILRGDDRFEEVIINEGTDFSGTRRTSYWRVRDRRDDENAE
tara:strand:+ start:666 stop:944 length:279 start_codon:yes stop_codon:yes gene_type:complete